MCKRVLGVPTFARIPGTNLVSSLAPQVCVGNMKSGPRSRTRLPAVLAGVPVSDPQRDVRPQTVPSRLTHSRTLRLAAWPGFATRYLANTVVGTQPPGRPKISNKNLQSISVPLRCTPKSEVQRWQYDNPSPASIAALPVRSNAPRPPRPPPCCRVAAPQALLHRHP
jgi:hypothetical protein